MIYKNQLIVLNLLACEISSWAQPAYLSDGILSCWVKNLQLFEGTTRLIVAQTRIIALSSNLTWLNLS